MFQYVCVIILHKVHQLQLTSGICNVFSEVKGKAVPVLN